MMLQKHLIVIMVAIALATLPGCFSAFYDEPTPPQAMLANCARIELASRSKVYVFMFNGLDPFNSDTLGWTSDYFKALGFPKIYCGHPFHEDQFVDEVIRVHGVFPDARFIVIGSDTGAEAARDLVQKVGDKGVHTEMLIYLQPRGLAFDTPSSETPVQRIVCLQTETLVTNNNPKLEGVEMLTLSDATSYGVVRHPALLELVSNEMVRLAQQIPVEDVRRGEAFPPINPDDVQVHPRNIEMKKPKTKDDWDFLKATETNRIRDAILIKQAKEEPATIPNVP